MSNIKLTIEYDGTNYHGWQSQKNALSIQDTLENALRKLTGEECKLIGSSRTDVGVHALGQVANFHTNSRIPPEKFSYALNSILPKDIAIKESAEVPLDFHSRHCAKGKKYKYIICNSTYRPALLRNRAWHISSPLNIEAMSKAAMYFQGTHDFSAFRATGSSVKTSVRTIMQTSLKANEEIIEFEISGNGFLYNMVRIIMGTLAEVGMGKIPYDAVPEIIESCDRTRAGKTAPAQGLYLVEVYY